jgi:tetratricopeptide (TPR) repeat protein
MNCLHLSARVALAFSLAFFFQEPVVGQVLVADKVSEAKTLIDTYYGDKTQLDAAEILLRQTLLSTPNDANAYVQAARLTIKGGHVFRSEFRPGTVEAYAELIDKALAIDAKNQKAHILRAEVFDIRGLFAQEKIELDQAKALGESDPWLWIGYGRFFAKTRDYASARACYTRAKALGPGRSAEERNAYIASLQGLVRFESAPSGLPMIKELGRLVKQERHPKDAWAMSNFAETFLRLGFYDDAIQFSREALAVMSFGAARLTLTAALYGKAARLINEGKKKDADGLILEAARFRFDRTVILDSLSADTPETSQLLPILEKIVK